MGRATERMEPDFSKMGQLLASLEGIQICRPQRADECCGFGGTFAVTEEAVSCMMGRDRINDHVRAGAEVLTAADMSCLMHMDGLLRRRSRETRCQVELRVMHVAQILAGRSGAPDASH
jgi:L-lactate dehydrogenase complex protein LldE